MIDNITDAKKLEYHYWLFRTSLHFYHYLCDDNFNRADASILDALPKEQYNKILVTQCALILSIYKDKYLIKKDLYINETGLNLLLEPIISGHKTLDEKIDILNNLRHKLLHGDYYIKDDIIILNNDGLETPIKIDSLCELCSHVIRTGKMLKKEKNIKEIGFIKTNTIDKYGKIQTLKDLEKVLRETEIVEFIDEPVEGYERTNEYVTVLEKFYESYESMNLYNKCSSHTRTLLILKLYDKLFKEYHIKLSYNIKKATELSSINIVKKIYMENKKYFDIATIKDQYTFLLHLIYSYANKDRTNICYAALANNIKLLNAYRKRENGDISDLEYYDISIFYLDDMTIAAAIGAFYGIYQYGLESILSKDLNLKQIVSNETFDFSLLDMSVANDPKMDKTASKKRFECDLKGLNNKVDSCSSALAVASRNYSSYNLSAKKHDKKVEIKLLNNIKEKLKELDEAQELVDASHEFLDGKCELFSLNYNIISHLRNAIAHGNVIICPYEDGDSLLDRIIEFNDIHEGRVTYTLKIKFKDFIYLLSQRNAENIYDYLTELISNSNKELVDNQNIKSNSLIKKIIKTLKK
jgi:hypothetical protein